MIVEGKTRNAETEMNVNTAAPNRWDTPTKWFAWAVLIAFTALSAYMNGAYAVLTSSLIWFHAGIPGVVLVLGVFLELTFLSSAHRAAKRIVVTGLGLSFAVVLIASYLAVLHVTSVWNPHAPQWVNAALAALPDVVMVLAATVVLSLRMRDQSQARRAPKRVTESRLRRLADAATTRAEAALSVPATPQVNPVTEAPRTTANTPANAVAEVVTDAHGGPVNTPATTVVEAPATPAAPRPPSVTEPPRTTAKTPAAPRPPSVQRPAKPAIPDELAPHMDTAERMVADGVVARKTPAELAEVIAAVRGGKTDNAIRASGIASASTASKVRAELARVDDRHPELVLTAV